MHPHLKQFQVRQYKVAEKRIYKITIFAWYIHDFPFKTNLSVAKENLKDIRLYEKLRTYPLGINGNYCNGVFNGDL